MCWSIFPSHTLSVAQNDLPLRTRVCTTGRPLASIYQRCARPGYCLSFWQEANQTNKRTNGEQDGKRGGERNKRQNSGTSFANLFNQGSRYENPQIKKPEKHHGRELQRRHCDILLCACVFLTAFMHSSPSNLFFP